MEYRELGNTGLRVSEIGLGCEGFIDKPANLTQEMFQLAFDAGINCMDLYSPNPTMHAHVGQAIAQQRENFILQAHLCSIWQGGQYKRTRNIAEVTQAFDDMLQNLQTSYIDIGMIHYVDSIADWEEVEGGPVLAYAQQLKAAGKIRCIGLSSHNPIAALAAVNSGHIDVLMFSVNPCYDLQPGDEDLEKLWADESYENELVGMDPERQKLYETCQRLGVGITVMKAFGGGDLLSTDSPAGKALTTNQCIHYALTRPAVASVMVGAHSVQQLANSLAYVQAADAERDYATALANFPKISWKGHCMYCGHCAPCPVGIDIAAATKFLNLVKAQKTLPETVREHYAALPNKAAECIQCGVCESRCPFEVDIRHNMREAAELFGQ